MALRRDSIGTSETRESADRPRKLGVSALCSTFGGLSKVAPHGRKYRDKNSHPIPLWNGVFEHYDRIGGALWEFAWCIDRVTKERDGVGLVLGGSPVKLRHILDDLNGSRKETVRRHLDDLEVKNYIRRRRTPYGYVIEVLNSRKFGIWRKEKPQNAVSLGEEKPILEREKPIGGSEKHVFVVYKEDAAVTQQKDAAGGATAAPSVWKQIGSGLPMGGVRFQKIVEHYLAMRGENPLSDAMERAIQQANKVGVKVPPPFFDAKRLVEQRKTGELAGPVAAIPELEAAPWAK